MKGRFVAGLVGLLLIGSSVRGEFSPEIVTYECRPATGKITVAGRLSETAWRGATDIVALYEIRNPEQGGAVKYRPDKITIKLLYDKDFLYIGAVIRDRDIVADPKSPTRSQPEVCFLNGDTFEVFIQPKVTEPVYYEYHVNPLNAWWNARYPARNGYMPWLVTQWSSAARHAVTVDGTINRLDEDCNWTVEQAIPIREITDNKEHPVTVVPGVKWRISFCLYDYQFYFDDCNNCGTLKYFSTSKLERINYHERKNEFK